jgi:hypothetical protein
VTKDEFLRAYNKNKTPAVSREQALKDYLDLYIKFKLKVAAAKDIHLVPSYFCKEKKKNIKKTNKKKKKKLIFRIFV